jgi:hypothetical protein
VLGTSDGFACSTALHFLRRGDLTKTELVPLTFSPRFIQYELSGTTIVGSMARTHKGYCVSATTELSELRKKLADVQVAVTACGAVLKSEPKSRLARLFRETQQKQSYEDLRRELNAENVIGDLMYYFLRADSSVYEKPEVCKKLEFAEPAELYDLTPDVSTPVVYALSLEGLVRVAQRGVVLLLVHGEERAQVAHAALQKEPRPVSFIVATEAAAQAMSELLRKEGK